MLNIQENVILAPLTTFKIGGAAKYFIEVNSEEELQETIKWAKENGEKFFILAGGSNVLFADEGYDGLIVKLNLRNIKIESGAVIADAGVVLANTIMQACKSGLTGMENMYGIPGTVGGAVRGNAGAFGTEVKDVLKNVRALNSKTGELKEFINKESALGYRTSFFKQNPEWIVLSATFVLGAGDSCTCEARARETLATRSANQLQDVLAAGSFFKNPTVNQDVQKMFETDKGQPARAGRVPAGWLIEKVGIKGKCIADACISEQRANYLVNTGGATATDIITLSEKIKKTVKEKFGVVLEEEVQIVDF